MFTIVHIDRNSNVDRFMAGDPTPGRGANEFETHDEAMAAAESLDDPGEDCYWEVREQS